MSRVGVGANYLAVCQRAAAAGDELAAQALEGLQSVLSGRLRQWQMEYPCRTPQGELWFLMFAAPLPLPSGGAVVAHFDITDRRQMEMVLRQRHDALTLRQRWLEKVLQLGKEISRTTDLTQCLHKIGESVRHGLDFDRVGIFLYDPSNDRFVGVLGVSRTGSWVESFRLMEGEAEGALRQLVAHPDGFLYITNYHATFRGVADPEMEGVTEHAAVAMWTGDTPVGVLCVDNLLTQRPMAPEQLEALRLFAGYAGIAIQNARLWQERQRYYDYAQRVLELGKEISRVTDLRACLLQIRNAVVNGLGFDRAAVWLYDEERDIFRGTYGTSRTGELTDEWSETIPREGTHTLRRVLEEPDGFVYTPNYSQQLNLPPDHAMFGVNEHVTVALWGWGKPIGVLCADNLLTQRPMAPEQLEALRLFAGYAGIAIQNARLWEEQQKRSAQLATLNRLVHVANQRLDPVSIVRIAVQELSGQLPESGLVAVVRDVAGQQWQVAAANDRGIQVLRHLGVSLGDTLTPEALPSLEDGVLVWTAEDQCPCPLGDAARFAGWAAGAIFAITFGEEPLGVLAVFCPETEYLDAGALSFLRAVSDHLAVILHNAHLFTRLQSAYEELQRTQAALLQQERLRVLGQMASGMAHEVNNALVPILAFAELLETVDHPALREAAVHTRRAVDDIVTMVRQLQAFYRPHHQQEALEPVNLNEVVQQVVEMTRPRWYDMPQREGVTIRLITALDPDLPPIAGVAAELREALTNVLFNAVDAIVAKGARSGEITIRTYRHDGVVVEVQDTGVGMDDDIKSRCLEPFFTTKGERGTGLGLAIVYGIVQRHEGRLDIESRLGQGTLVRLWLPLRVPMPAATPPVEPTVPSLRVLVIDDDARVRVILQTMLQHLGHRAVTAGSGREGLARLEEALSRGDAFDMLITDLGMPEMSGEEVIARVKRVLPHLPVIVLTGWGREQAPPTADGALGKPVRLQELRRAIAEVWRKTR